MTSIPSSPPRRSEKIDLPAPPEPTTSIFLMPIQGHSWETSGRLSALRGSRSLRARGPAVAALDQRVDRLHEHADVLAVALRLCGDRFDDFTQVIKLLLGAILLLLA